MADKPVPAARRFGSVVQGIVLGLLLFLALSQLISLSSGAQVFRYQGF